MFFDLAQLKYLGQNVIIGQTVRILYPHLVELHDNTIIDDFTFISTGLILKQHSSIESGCVIMGGQNNKVTIGEYSALGAHCDVLCGSHNFKMGLCLNHNNHVPQGLEFSDITIGQHVMLGVKSTILPGSIIGDGARVGAYSLVKSNLDPWTLYSGIPAKKMGEVDREQVLNYLDNFLYGS